MPIAELHLQLKKYFKELEQRIQRDNQQLKLLRQLIHEGEVEYHPGTVKLQEMIVECVEKHGGQAQLPTIREWLEKEGANVARHKLSVVLTKCPALRFNRNKNWWELRKNAELSTKEEHLQNIHH